MRETQREREKEERKVRERGRERERLYTLTGNAHNLSPKKKSEWERITEYKHKQFKIASKVTMLRRKWPFQYPCLENPMDRAAWLQSIGSQESDTT